MAVKRKKAPAKKAPVKKATKKIAAKPAVREPAAKTTSHEPAAKLTAREPGAKPTSHALAAKPGPREPAAKPTAHALATKPGPRKPAAKPTARALAAKPAVRKPTPRAALDKAASKPEPKGRATGIQPLDLSALPPEAVTTAEKWFCLACVLDVFTRFMGVAAKTAHTEIKRYTPPVSELYAETLTRPYFAKDSAKDPCPYCGSAAKWHAQVRVHRIESGKATDAARRELVKSLPKAHDEFAVVEEKATQQLAFFEWLEKVGTGLDLENPRWLRDVSVHYLGRKEPKVDWEAEFQGVHGIRRSRRLESGWEVDTGRLFLAPMLFDELLLVQYLVSRSHKAGGLTLEGRYTLPELFVRLRNSGYLRSMEVAAGNAGDALEQLVEKLSGGETSIKFYHVVDRRDFLDKLKALRLEKVPRPKKR